MSHRFWPPAARRGSGSAALLLALTLTTAPSMQAEECGAREDDRYVCGIHSAEDLVHLAGTPWLLASAFSGESLLNAINTAEKTWQVLAPGASYGEEHDKARFPHCPGAIGNQRIVTHGLHLADNGDYDLTLYAVGHGDREAIEVFDITVDGAAVPSISWVGCVPTPDSQAANSVVSLSHGDLLATIPLETGFEFAQSMEGIGTGAVYRWIDETGTWKRIDATEQPYPNGITVSSDESRFYVASSGTRQVLAYSNALTPRLLGVSDALEIIPDNLHRDMDGELVTAGLLARYTPCSPYNDAGDFDLAAFATCPRPYQVVTVDPDTLAVEKMIAGGANAAFSNVTMGVEVDGTWWLGSFGADRVAYRLPAPESEAEYFSLRPEVELAYGYRHAVKTGNTVKISGAVSMDASGSPVAAGDLEQQMKNVYSDLRRVLAHYGLGFEHVTVENIFTTDMDRFVALSPAYRNQIYQGKFPTGTWLEVDALALPEFMLEIELEAHSPK